ncbi:MAG: N-acetylmuramoyl-L-alanine amidase [Bacteroidota bacterium]
MLRLSWFLPMLAIFVMPVNLSAQQHKTIQTIVIDAGHGGHDPGAIGLEAKEKNINLAIALKLGSLIKRSMKDIRVIYTRDQDNFVELYRRAEIANKNKADLFICIHCNANPNHALKGAETYVMGLHKSQANLNIAKQENASILLESNYQSTYNGFDPNADESYIIFSLYQNSNLDQSTDLAAAIQEQLLKRQGSAIHGVRQAGFMVLYKTTMPSVLVETGYLSNPGEEKFLMSGAGQDHIVSAIFRAFRSFVESHNKPVVKNGKSDSSALQGEAPVQKGIRDTLQPAGEPGLKGNLPVKPASVNGLSFRIQIAASAGPLAAGDPRLAGFDNVTMYRHNGMNKYTVGDVTTLKEAEKLLEEVRHKGINDAFIVIFRNGVRIPQSESNRLLEK